MNARSLLPALLTTTLVTPAFAYDHGHDRHEEVYRTRAPTGTVQVVNRAGTLVTVYVDGNAPRTLGPEQSAWFTTVAGDTTVRATYRVFGQEIPLETRRLYVQPGRTSSTTLAPATQARVLVSNTTPRYARVVADGREVAALRPGEDRVLVLGARPTTLQLFVDDHLVRTQRVEMRPYDEPRVRIEMPTRGDLTVQNPLPIPVRLVAQDGQVRTVEPYGRTTYDLPLGTVHITATRLTGERIDDTVACVEPWTTTQWRVDPPSDGLLALDNDHWLDVKVMVDGRTMASLRAEVDGRLAVGLGWHHVEARDASGREIVDTWVEIERYDVAEVDIGSHRRDGGVADAGYGRYDGRGPDHEDDGRYDDHRPAESGP